MTCKRGPTELGAVCALTIKLLGRLQDFGFLLKKRVTPSEKKKKT